MKTLLAIILALYASFFAGFGSYYLIDKYLIDPRKPSCAECNTYSPSTAFNLDLTDFDILLVSPEDPNIMFHINHLDNRVDKYKTTFLNYSLDGKTLKSVEIPFEDIIWKQLMSNKNNSEYSVSGKFKVDGREVSFSVPRIRLGMVIRAQPDAGKYGGVTENPSALLTIDKKELTAYAGVTSGFFAKYPSVNMQELGIKTHWAMYFDKDYNFYHLDLTQVQNPTPEYYSHAFLSEIKAEDESVIYYDPARVIGGNGVITVGYSKDLDFITKDFNQYGQTNPYKYAKMNILKEDSGGMGVYTYIDTAK